MPLFVATDQEGGFVQVLQAVAAGTPFVMMSLANYDRIDPRVPAAFSSKIIRGMLREELGFRGVVISDSLVAEQVHAWSAASRAIKVIKAGGDLVLMTAPALLLPNSAWVSSGQPTSPGDPQ